MKDIINSIIELLFSKVPFSKQSEILKNTLKQRLFIKYEESKNNNEIETIGELIMDCKDIESACRLVNYPIENIEQYENNGDCINKKDYKKINKKLKRYHILMSICMMFMVRLIIEMLCCFNITLFIFSLVLVLFFTTIFFLIKKKKKTYLKEIDYLHLKYDLSAQKNIHNDNDRYTKKLVNTIMLDIAVATFIILFLLLAVLLSRYTYLEVINQILYFSFVIQLLVFFTVKHYLNKSLTDIYFIEDRKNIFNKYLIRLIKYTGIYFMVVIILMFILSRLSSYVYNWIIVFYIIYFIALLIFNLTIRKGFVFNNLNINFKRVITLTLLVVCLLGYNIMSMDMFLTQPYINQISQILQQKDDIIYNEDTGVYTITTQKDNFKILQLTDIHLGGSIVSYSKDIKSLEACYTLIKHTQPDLVVVTGDLVFPMGIMSFSLNNNAPIMQFANFMRNTGIPWAFTYGNHDTEGIATLDRNEFDELMKSLSFKTSANLLYPYIQPDVYGRNNQMIEIRNDKGKLMQALFLIDSNDYIPTSTKINEYDYIHDDQVKWYEKNVMSLSEKEGYIIPSMLFFHIPLREYIIANDLYEKGSQEVKYYYGTLGETMIDKICASDYDSSLFETAVKLKSTKAMFFGHDHYNNQSLEYLGIRMTYGYSIDYLAMPGIEDDEEQRGATLITINQDGNFSIEPYRLIDIK